MKPKDMKAALASVEAVIPYLEPEVAYSPDRIASRCCRFLGQDLRARQVKEVLDALDCEPLGRHWTGAELQGALEQGHFAEAQTDCEAQDEELLEAYRKKYLRRG